MKFKSARQGDVLVRVVDRLPDGLTEQPTSDDVYVIAHSETGHHHVVSARHAHYYVANAMIAYLVLERAARLEHLRSFDRHDDLELPAGIIEIRRAREYIAYGWRRVED